LLAQHRLYTQVFISHGATFGRVMVQENASASLSNDEETKLLLARCGFAEDDDSISIKRSLHD